MQTIYSVQDTPQAPRHAFSASPFPMPELIKAKRKLEQELLQLTLRRSALLQSKPTDYDAIANIDHRIHVVRQSLAEIRKEILFA